MESIIGWSIGLIVIIIFGSFRIKKMYEAEALTNKEYFQQGIVLILYSTLVVGSAQFLNLAIEKYNVNTLEISGCWIVVGLLATYIKYLAPFVFAAIGVNMVSYSLTNKNT